MKLSLIIPTYNEKENIQKLIILLQEVFFKNKIIGEIIIVDDNSPDGTGQILDNLKGKYQNLKVVHRKGKLGLSSAVIEGFKVSDGDILGVMDADLSHPVKKILEMYESITTGKVDFVIGSRYIKGGEIIGWNLYRKILSKGATILARIFVSVKDPMSGFFMIKKELILGKEINPKGFKILLELLIKTDYKNLIEIPITFNNRTAGKSKAGYREIIFYLKNLIGYIFYEKHIILEFIRFAFVGFIGTLINILILFTLTEYFNIYYLISALFSLFIAATINYILDKIWAFGEKINDRIVKKYLSFLLVSLLAFLFNIIILYIFTEFFGIYYIVSQILAIGFSLIINFIGNKIWTFHQ